MVQRSVVPTLLLTMGLTASIHASILNEAPKQEPSQAQPAETDVDQVWGYLLELRSQRLYELKQAEITVGRLRKSDLRLTSPQVSRRHASIRWSGSEARLEDLGSTNGTRRNGTEIGRGRSIALKPGDLVSLADQRFLFHFDRDALWEDELELQLENRFIELKVSLPGDPVIHYGPNEGPGLDESDLGGTVSTATISAETGEVTITPPSEDVSLAAFTPQQAAYVGNARALEDGIELSLWAAANPGIIASRRAAFDHLKHTTLRIRWDGDETEDKPIYRRDLLVTVFSPYPRDRRARRAGNQLSQSLARGAHTIAVRDLASSLRTRHRLDRNDSDAVVMASEARSRWKEARLEEGGPETVAGESANTPQYQWLEEANAEGTGKPDRAHDETSIDRADRVDAAPSSGDDARFRVAVNTVNLPVTVLDEKDRLITGLEKDNFTVYEDGAPQEIRFFSHGEAPLRLVILLDTSSSMRMKIELARRAAIQFVRSLKPGDEIKVVEFNDRVLTLAEFTSDFDQVERAILQTEPSGATSLYTALYASLKDLAGAPMSDNERRGLVVLSDGNDTRSLVTFEDVREVTRKSDVLVYAISLRATERDLKKEKYFKAKYELDLLAKESGARSLAPASIDDLAGVYQVIAAELKSQYLIGYSSTKSENDGSWRRLEVMSKASKTAVRTRTGYYAPRPSRKRRAPN